MPILVRWAVLGCVLRYIGLIASVRANGTETADLAVGSPAERNLDAIRSAEFGLAIDDFGTVFSNLDVLQS